jgi:hypothetical protein
MNLSPKKYLLFGIDLSCQREFNSSLDFWYFVLNLMFYLICPVDSTKSDVLFDSFTSTLFTIFNNR